MEKLKEVLKSISNWFKTTGESKAASKSSVYKWLLTIFVGAISLLGLAYAWYVQWKQGKELAKLRHEKDVVAEEVFHKELEKLDKEASGKAHDLDQEIILLTIKEDTIKANITKAENDHKTIKDQIENIRDWASADRINRAN